MLNPGGSDSSRGLFKLTISKSDFKIMDLMKCISKLCCLYILLLTLSCSQSEEDFIEQEQLQSILNFISDIDTKGTDITNANIDNLGVFAFYTGTQDWSLSSTPNYIYNRMVNRQMINNIWSDWFYTPVMYWPRVGEKLSFFAYAPFATKENGIVVSSQTKQGVPTLTYEVSEIIRSQIDLLYTMPLWNQTKDHYLDSRVKLNFKHALTKVLFRAKIQEGREPASGQFIKVNSVSVTQIKAKGQFAYPSSQGEAAKWKLSTRPIKNFKLERGQELKDEVLTQASVNITSADGQLNLLPQKISADAKLIVEYGVYDDNNQEVESLVSEHLLSSLIPQLIMGKAVVFTIQLGVDSPGKVQVSIQPWEEAMVEGDFSATYLNLSRTNITETTGKEIFVHYDTDYRYPIYAECIASTGTLIADISITAENGIIQFPSNLQWGEYTFRIKAGGISRNIYLCII